MSRPRASAPRAVLPTRVVWSFSVDSSCHSARYPKLALQEQVANNGICFIGHNILSGVCSCGA